MNRLPELSEFISDTIQSTESMIAKNRSLLILLILTATIRALVPSTEATLAYSGILSVIAILASMLGQLVLIRWFLRNVGAAEDEQILPFKQATIPFILTTLLSAILVGAASILLVIPGVILFFAFLVSDFVLVASKRRFLDALIESRALMDGYKSQVFGYAIAMGIPIFLAQFALSWATIHSQNPTLKIALMIINVVVGRIALLLFISFRGTVFLHVRRRNL